MGSVLCSSVTAAELPTRMAAGERILAGSPVADVRELHAADGVEAGIWQMTAGTVTDVESAEIFLVIAGAGELTLGDGTAVALQPGVVVRLDAGERTTWTVTEPLRKLYLALP